MGKARAGFPIRDCFFGVLSGCLYSPLMAQGLIRNKRKVSKGNTPLQPDSLSLKKEIEVGA